MDEASHEPDPAGTPAPDREAEGVKDYAPAAVNTLKRAMQRACVDNAERAGVISDLRATRLVRLEMLREALEPLVRQIPADVDLFEFGLLPGIHPRLFIDLIGFVEMGRDTRLYRFFQDTRYGRTLVEESGDVDTIVDAVTRYVAHRLLERDRALAASEALVDVPSSGRHDAARQAPSPTADASRVSRPRWAGTAFAFLIDVLGSVTFFLVLAFLGWLVWNALQKPL